MTDPDRVLSIIGAGIVGLMVAYKARTKWPDRQIIVIDEGSDPRSQMTDSIPSGATWSGLDARHISMTETGPWTSPHRVELIERSSLAGGWNCLGRSHLSVRESRWLEDFQDIARQPVAHRENYDAVMSLNEAGMSSWARLRLENSGIFKPTSNWDSLPIVCTTQDDLISEQLAEFELDPKRVTDPIPGLPSQLKILEPKLADGTLSGSFLVAGTAYRVKTLCRQLIEWLERRSVTFQWAEKVDLDTFGKLPVPAGDVVWAAGVSTGPTRFLSSHDILLQGVAGCWIALPNPGIEHPFKVLATEPVNFINCTPIGSILVLSGGYGWVGERSYDEVISLSQPIADAFAGEVSRLLTSGTKENLDNCETAVCIRPALPSGRPLIRLIEGYEPSHRVMLCVGHAAGGFTEAPAVAEEVLRLVDA